MSYMFVSYASRTISMNAYNFLNAHGVVCSVISTPAQANIGCGLSVKFNENDFATVSGLLGTTAPTFRGYFHVSNRNGKRIVTRA